MTGDNDELQDLSTRTKTAERRIDAIKSTLDLMVQELKKLSSKINDQILTDVTYRSGQGHPSIDFPPPPPPSHPPQQSLLNTIITNNESATCVVHRL